MINRENWQDVNLYLKYLEKVKQLDDQTIHRRRSMLHHLLQWAGDKPLGLARNIDPTFPVFLLTSRFDGKDKSLSAPTMAATCGTVRRFYEWARMEMPRKYSKVTPSWLDQMRPPRSRGMQSEIHVHEYYTLEEMRKVIALKPATIREEREQAAMAFVYLSGMRADAFATVPISCVNIEDMTVNQYPSEGVRTKNHKAKQTFLLPIPELINVVQAWDDKVRSLLPNNAMWYAGIRSNGEDLIPMYDANPRRGQDIAEGCELICEKVGIKYRSPHKLRNGHVVYGTKLAKTIEDFKAISQNVMHESMDITQEIYAELSGGDVKKVIEKFKPNDGGTALKMPENALAKLMMQTLKEHPELLDALSKNES
jgi:site-specific recombinase XerC